MISVEDIEWRKLLSYRNIDFKVFDRIDLKTGLFKCRCCGKILYSKRRKYCSDECRNKFYDKYTWVEIRRDILIRDNFRCQFKMVNKKNNVSWCCYYYEDKDRMIVSNLEVHHIIPINSMWKMIYDMVNEGLIRKEDRLIAYYNMVVEHSNLITFCKKHHGFMRRNNDRKERKYYFNDYFYYANLKYYPYRFSKWKKFLKLNEREFLQKRLEQFFR